jgi:hypothetical protein
MNIIQQTILDAVPARHRRASKGWISFDAPCCSHCGESPDKRSRGGLLVSEDDGGFSYHCFNCQYKASWKPGYHLNFRVRNLLAWMGVAQDRIQLLVFDAMRNFDRTIVQEEFKQKFTGFKSVALPDHAPINELVAANAHNENADLNTVVDFIAERGFEVDDYNWLWSPSKEHGLNRRVIIPYTWQGKIIGYTARTSAANSKLKYFNQVDSDYVFNIDAQTADKQVVIVTEGPLDAIAVGGVAVLTNEVNENKAEIIESLGKQVIVVPDQDSSGRRLVEQAIQYGWGVSFPLWETDIKDCADANRRYGKLYTLRSILADTETSALKIKLRSKAIFS